MINNFVAYGLLDAPGDVCLDRGVRIRGLGDLPIPTGGVDGIARSAPSGSAS